MRKIAMSVALLAVIAGPVLAASAAKDPGMTPASAWRRLAEGNDRFARGLVLRPHADAERRRELAKREEPFAVVVACSDSRVSPEIIFDQGLGDLFAVRTLGNAAEGDYNVASIEYAVKHHGTRLVVVLGHDKCEMVTEALRGVPKDDQTRIDELAGHLKAAADQARDKVVGLGGDELVAEGVDRNVLYQIHNLLKESPMIAAMVESGKVKVVGGVYSLESGRVRWLGEHPSEKAVIEGKKP